MKHTEIIQKLLDATADKKYLEIGIAKGTNFDAVCASHKVGVDPQQPNDFIKQLLNDNCEYHCMTSDQFFKEISESSIRFDVIFIDGLHEAEQVYRDVINSLKFLAHNGIIVVHDTIPTNEEAGTPASQMDFSKPIRVWTGDVWKAIVRLRSFHEDLSIFTLDCYLGCTVITRGIPESMLDNSKAQIDALGYSDFSNHYISFLNLKNLEYLDTFLLRLKERRAENRNRLYVKDIKAWKSGCERNYFIDAEPEVQVIKNGIILPVKKSKEGDFIVRAGGVCDDRGLFIAGHIYGHIDDSINYDNSNNSYDEINIDDVINVRHTYPITGEVEHIKEVVVYGGVISNHFGHMFAESLSRMWWFVKNPNSGHKYIFVSLADHIDFMDFFIMLGMQPEDIILLKKPTKFDTVIIPEQAHIMENGFKQSVLMVYDAIRDSVKPAPYKKVYLTKSQLEQKQIVNEEYFEEYYRQQGYEMICPEKLSIEEQVAIMAGAESVVCTSGTLQHLILFSHNGVELIVLNKTNSPIVAQFLVNQARSSKCTFIDVSANILPTINNLGVSLFMPTLCWKEYIFDQSGIILQTEIDVHNYLSEYITQWTSLMINNPWILDYIDANSALANIVIDGSDILLGNKMHEPTKHMFYDAFSLKGVRESKHYNRIREFCDRNSKNPIYFYGTGGTAKMWTDFVESENIDFDGYIISDGQPKKNVFMGRNVYYLSEIKNKQCGIILSLYSKYTREVLPKLIHCGFENILQLQ